jgi:hypothetical protein
MTLVDWMFLAGLVWCKHVKQMLLSLAAAPALQAALSTTTTHLIQALLTYFFYENHKIMNGGN